MVDIRARIGRAVLTALSLASLVACSSTQLKTCDQAGLVRPPRNFGHVVDADGTQTAIYRGGQPKTCDELRYLQSLGVKSILKLNDGGSSVDKAEKEESTKLGMQIVSFPFAATAIGQKETCPMVREALAFLMNTDNLPVYVHCAAGKDRTGYIVGMFEKEMLKKPTAKIMGELDRYGHHGWRSMAMSQIDRELASDTPTCAAP